MSGRFCCRVYTTAVKLGLFAKVINDRLMAVKVWFMRKMLRISKTKKKVTKKYFKKRRFIVQSRRLMSPGKIFGESSRNEIWA